MEGDAERTTRLRSSEVRCDARGPHDGWDGLCSRVDAALALGCIFSSSRRRIVPRLAALHGDARARLRARDLHGPCIIGYCAGLDLRI